MKLFIGIKIYWPQKQYTIQQKVSYERVNKSIKWVKKENLHLTLVFIGSIKGINASTINETLEHVLQQHSPFKLKINGIDCFCKKRRNSILYLKVAPSNRLFSLQKDIQLALENVLANFKSEYDTYIPHITIARYSKSLNSQEQFRQIFKAKIHENIRIREIQLFESRSTPHGVEYHILDRYKLK